MLLIWALDLGRSLPHNRQTRKSLSIVPEQKGHFFICKSYVSGIVTEYPWPVYIARKKKRVRSGRSKTSRHWMGLFDIYGGVNLVRYEPKSIIMLASFPQTLQTLVSSCIFFLTAGFSKYTMFHEKDDNDSHDKPVSDNGP